MDSGKKEEATALVKAQGQKAITERQRKAFRIARKLCALSRTLPNERRASLFLRNVVRFERVMMKRPPFQNSEAPSVLDGLKSDPASYSQTQFQTSTGTVRAL